MPVAYAVLHLLASTALFCAVRRLASRPRLQLLLVIVVLGMAALGYVVERRSELAWTAMRLGFHDLVFFTNLTAEGAAVLLALMAPPASDRRARLRAGVLGAGLLAAAGASYAWYFAPLPAGLSGAADREGFCAQTTEDSCSAAAAAMLLHNAGIPASEEEMARLCLTRAGYGTPPLGLLRGLAIRAA
jgi:hypothetical protein